jgi:hypothetical protein
MGHYYSFIKEREDVGNWFKFNDSHVMDFDANALKGESFGGFEVTKATDKVG